jgi:hypothetical protein
MKDSFYEETECVFDKIPKYHMEIALDFNADVGREVIFKPTIGSKGLHQISNDNGVVVVNFATLKNLLEVQCSHIVTFINLLGGKTHNKIGHVLIGRRWHSSILHARSFRVADCDTDHYLVEAKFKERPAVSKQSAVYT